MVGRLRWLVPSFCRCRSFVFLRSWFVVVVVFSLLTAAILSVSLIVCGAATSSVLTQSFACCWPQLTALATSPLEDTSLTYDGEITDGKKKRLFYHHRLHSVFKNQLRPSDIPPQSPCSALVGEVRRVVNPGCWTCRVRASMTHLGSTPARRPFAQLLP